MSIQAGLSFYIFSVIRLNYCHFGHFSVFSIPCVAAFVGNKQVNITVMHILKYRENVASTSKVIFICFFRQTML